MSFFDKILNGISNWAKETNETYEQERENMKYKTNEQLLNIAQSGNLGKRKAAIEELRRRGLID